MYRAKKICMEGGKTYYPGEIWKGEGIPSEKNFSLVGEREIVKEPPAPKDKPAEKKELPVTIPPIPEPPKPPEKALEDLDWYPDIVKLAMSLGISAKGKKKDIIAKIREAQNANGGGQSNP